MKTRYKFSSLMYLLLLLSVIQSGWAQTFQPLKESIVDTGKIDGTNEKKATKQEEDQISTVLIAGNKNACFENRAKYIVEVRNNTGNPQTGKVSYKVFSEAGQVIKTDSLNVNLDKKSSAKYNFEIPESHPGFYRANFMVNVTDYNDTTRCVFGIRPQEIPDNHKKPIDFDIFWKMAKHELASVNPNFKVIPHPEMDKDNRHTFLFEMQSIGNMTIRGWMTLPAKKHKKFAVWVGFPGYQVDLKPIYAQNEHLAIITLNVRGQGNSRGPIDTRRNEYISYHIEDKNTYVMRGVLMDCIRCIDFIYSRPELNHDKIFVTGGNMGGYLALATAGLDSRVKFCSAQNPILGDVRRLVDEPNFPMSFIRRYVATQPGLTMDKVLDVLDYYDAKNFATTINCQSLIGIGLLDPLAPPVTEYAIYNNIPDKKQIMVFKDLAHQVNDNYAKLEANWLTDEFALFRY
jgi:cephalosporin-C deacetylase